MDTLQIQISELRNKIDSLHELIEQIGDQVKALSNKQSNNKTQESYSLPNFPSGTANVSSPSGDSEYQLTHKDILVDDNSSTSSTGSGNENFSPDTQIRRLTAQLTAAYNRIAALEEQLLTYRIHS